MTNPDSFDPGIPTTRTLQIIIAALVGGLLVFLLISLLIQSGAKPAPNAPPPDANPALPILTILPLGYTAIAVALSFVIPRQFVKVRLNALAKNKPADRRAPRDGVPALQQVYANQLIISAALIEGAGLFCLVGYLIEGNPIVLGAALILIGLVALKFPRQPVVEQWIDDRLRTLNDLQTFSHEI